MLAPPADAQRRAVEVTVNGVLVASIYLPNGDPQPGPKFDYKPAWFAGPTVDHLGLTAGAGAR